MEELKNVQKPEKPTYEELEGANKSLLSDNQKLFADNKRLNAAVDQLKALVEELGENRFMKRIEFLFKLVDEFNEKLFSPEVQQKAADEIVEALFPVEQPETPEEEKK